MVPAERRLHRGPSVTTYRQKEEHVDQYQQHGIDSAAP